MSVVTSIHVLMTIKNVSRCQQLSWRWIIRPLLYWKSLSLCKSQFHYSHQHYTHLTLEEEEKNQHINLPHFQKLVEVQKSTTNILHYTELSKSSTSRKYNKHSWTTKRYPKMYRKPVPVLCQEWQSWMYKKQSFNSLQYKTLLSNLLKNEDKTFNRDRLICKEKGVEVNELFLNQYNVIKFSLLWKCEICIYAQWNIDEQWLRLLLLSQRKKSGHIIY